MNHFNAPDVADEPRCAVGPMALGLLYLTPDNDKSSDFKNQIASNSEFVNNGVHYGVQMLARQHFGSSLYDAIFKHFTAELSGMPLKTILMEMKAAFDKEHQSKKDDVEKIIHEHKFCCR
eukprot:191474_1